MVQHSNEHPTTAQLSAYVDKELASDELALCDAHLQTCARCQSDLADLRLTSALLRKMPQVEVPRSFALPLNMTVLPAAPDSPAPHRARPTRSHYILKSTLRALSTLAAVIGLVFILAGVAASLTHGGATFNSSSATLGPAHSAPHAPANGTPASGVATTPTAHLTAQAASTTPRAETTARPTSTPTPTAASFNNASPPPDSQFSLPPALDPGQPEGRLSIGAALLVLGILGILLARRPQREARR